MVDSEKDAIEFNIQDGQEIDLQRSGLSKIGFIGRGFDDDTESIRFELIGPNGRVHTESNPPYSLYGDGQGGRDIFGEVFDEGAYTLRAQVYDGNGGFGNLLGQFEVNFTIANTGGYPTELLLIDSELDQPVTEIIDGTPLIINLSTDPIGGFSFDLTDFPPETRSVKYELNGPVTITRTESAAPYALFGDASGGQDYFGRSPELGDYTLRVTTYDLSGGRGSVLSENNYEFSFIRDDGRGVVTQVINPITGTGDQVEVVTNESKEATITYQVYFQNQHIQGEVPVHPGKQVIIPLNEIIIPKGHMYFLKIRTQNEVKTFRLIK